MGLRAPFTLERLRAQREELFIGGSLLHALVHSSPHYMSFPLKSLNILLGLQCLDGTLMDPMWNDYNKLSIIFDKLSVKILSYLHKVD